MMAQKGNAEEAKDDAKPTVAPKKKEEKVPYAKTLLDTYMDDDLDFKNTKIEILKKESNFLRGNLTAEFDSDEFQNIPDLMM